MAGILPVSETECEAVVVDWDEAVFEVEAVLEDEAASDRDSAAEFAFDIVGLRLPAFWAFEVVVLMVSEGLRGVPFPLI